MPVAVPIKEIAVQVTQRIYKNNEDPNKAFLRVFERYPEATEHHKRRVLELVNRALFALYYAKGKYEHPLVDPAIVLGTLEEQTGPVIAKTASVCNTELAGNTELPTMAKTASVSEEEFDINPTDFHITGVEPFAPTEEFAYDSEFSKEANQTTSWDRILLEAEFKSLLRGKGDKIPEIHKVANLIDKATLEYLVEKKKAGAVEDAKLTEQVLSLARKLNL